MNKDTIFEVIAKLVGPIEPVGDQAIDDIRLTNLNTLIDVCKMLHILIDKIATDYSKTGYASKDKCGNAADNYLDWLGIDNSIHVEWRDPRTLPEEYIGEEFLVETVSEDPNDKNLLLMTFVGYEMDTPFYGIQFDFSLSDIIAVLRIKDLIR